MWEDKDYYVIVGRKLRKRQFDEVINDVIDALRRLDNESSGEHIENEPIRTQSVIWLNQSESIFKRANHSSW